jgi:hypothetical protein
MKDCVKDCVCCQGKEPEKRPDITIEEIEAGYNEDRSEKAQQEMKAWLKTRPEERQARWLE